MTERHVRKKFMKNDGLTREMIRKRKKQYLRFLAVSAAMAFLVSTSTGCNSRAAEQTVKVFDAKEQIVFETNGSSASEISIYPDKVIIRDKEGTVLKETVVPLDSDEVCTIEDIYGWQYRFAGMIGGDHEK